MEGMRMLKSSQIEHICIKNFKSMGLDLYPDQPCGKLPILGNFTSLKFSPVAPTTVEISLKLHTLLQTLIDSAPNLSSLKLRFYPDLTGCINLKLLKFNYDKFFHDACPDLDLLTVTEILAKVKDSLIELTLQHEGAGNWEYTPKVFKILTDL